MMLLLRCVATCHQTAISVVRCCSKVFYSLSRSLALSNSLSLPCVSPSLSFALCAAAAPKMYY